MDHHGRSKIARLKKKRRGKRSPSPTTTPKDCSVSEANVQMGRHKSPSPLEQAFEHHSDMHHSQPSDLEHSIVAISEQVGSSLTLHDTPCSDEKNQSSETLSSRDSLLRLGFNKVENNGSDTTEEDDFLSDLVNKSWDLPQPSEEDKKLMNIYPVLHIEQDEYNEICRPWNTTLIITILGKRFNISQLKENLKRIWGISEFEIIGLGKNYFSIRFTDSENWAVHYKKVLFEGPWVVSQHCVLVQMWSAYFDTFHNPLNRMVTWVGVPYIPLYCYNKKLMARLGDMIGKTLKVELCPLFDHSARSSKFWRGRFARICVELDQEKEQIHRVIIANEIINVEYEELGLICFDCGKYGHSKEICL